MNPRIAALAARTEPAAFARSVALHGLGGVLEQRHRPQLGQLPEPFILELRALRERKLPRALAMLRNMIKILRALEAAGIPALPLKGMPLSWSLYRDPFVRQSIDIDLLVDPACVPSALGVLQELGYAAPDRFPLRAAAIQHLLRSSHHLVLQGPGSTTLELHWRTDPVAATSLPRLSALLPVLERIEEGPLAGIRILPAPLLLRSLGTHAARSRCTRWKWGYDAAELVSAGQGGDPWAPAVFNTLDPSMRHALANAAAQWNLPCDSALRIPSGVSLSHTAARIERREHTGQYQRRSFCHGAVLHASAFVAQPALRARLAYLYLIWVRLPPDSGDRALALAWRLPLLAPLLRLLGTLSAAISRSRAGPSSSHSFWRS